MAGEDDIHRKRRFAVIGVSTFLLVAMVVAVTVGVSISQNDDTNEEPKDNNKTHVSSTMKAVTALCHPTDYKQECEDSLKSDAGNTTDPKELLKIVFNKTIKTVSEGLQKTRLLQEVEKEPRARMALDTCTHLMSLSIGEFRRSLDKMGAFDLNDVDDMFMNLKVWLSGAITYQETCLDGFENTTSPAGERMKQILQSAMHMSSNVLAIINDFAKTLAELNITNPASRRLLDLDSDNNPVLGHGDLDIPLWAIPRLRRLLSTKRKLKPNVVVAKDGSGKVKRINAALKMVPNKNKKPFVIYIKAGVYHEYVHVMRNMTNVVMIGDGGKKTRITGKKNFIDGVNTYRTATVAVEGDNFIAIKMGFENSAGPQKHQAVALRVQADMSIFYKCSMDGYQDTLYAHALRQFYRDCTISGTIDFVFGDAVSVFQNCTFVVRKPLENQQCIVTAQGRKERHQPSGIVIQGGSIVADPKYYPVRFTNQAYLARPWKIYSRTIVMNTFMDDLIQPEGFMPWQGNVGLDTCYYAEYKNGGPGSDKSKRVKWPGIKKITAEQADSFTPVKFFRGDKWIKATRIPYSSGMLKSKTKSKSKSKSKD